MSIYQPRDVDHLEPRGELADRLRALRWPEPSPAARRRAWGLLTARLEEGAMGAVGEPPVSPVPPRPATRGLSRAPLG